MQGAAYEYQSEIESGIGIILRQNLITCIPKK